MSDNATTIPSFEPVMKALKDVTGQFQFGTAAREYVERGAARAQETLTGFHDNAASLSRSLEASAIHGVETYANVSRNVAELAYRNAQAQLGLVQALAGVKSFEEGVRVYADFLKNANETNLAAMRGAADYVKDRVTEGATNARENLAKVFPRAA
ncbi:MAG: phasin family protein [Methylobacteriaceae bacterium]|nr:phasin family protein [Methylobacteriaceae bacterium]